MSQVKLTVDGKEIHAAAGSLLTEACKSVGIASLFYGRCTATLHSILQRRLLLPSEHPQEEMEGDRI